MNVVFEIPNKDILEGQTIPIRITVKVQKLLGQFRPVNYCNNTREINETFGYNSYSYLM